MDGRKFVFRLFILLLLGSCIAAAQLNKKVVFIGDSITFCWTSPAAFCPNPPGLPYPKAINAGVSGETLAQIDSRFIANVVAALPDIVVILGGTNDLRLGNNLPAMKSTLLDMIRLAKAAGIRVIVGTVPPSTNPQISLPQLLAFNQWITNDLQVDCACGVLTVADYFAAMADVNGAPISNFLFDGTHPAPLGYQVMSGVVMDAINGL